jgi:transposase
VDVHTESIAGAYLAHDPHAAGVSLGHSGPRPCDIAPRLRRRQANRPQLGCVDAAGPCGDWLERDLTTTGPRGRVVAPAFLPNKAGERVNTSRREALPRARLRRSGALTPVDVPPGADEALRDLRRAREAVIRDLKTAQLRLNACLLRQAIRSTGRATWGPAHLRWRPEVGGPPPAPQLVFPEDVRAGNEHPARLQRLAHARTDPGPTWRRAPVVDALQALRGGQCTGAVTRVAARGALTRVENPTPLMHSLGFTPSASSTGARRRQGGMTQTSHTHARRARREGAWASRDPAQLSRPLQRRLEKGPKPRQALRWQAPVRWCHRARPLLARGQNATQVVGALARALRALRWAMAQAVPRMPSTEASASPAAVLATVRPSSGRDAAPGWCRPRRREEAASHPRSSSEAGTRRTPVRWDPIHGFSRITRRRCLAPALPMDDVHRDEWAPRCSR